MARPRLRYAAITVLAGALLAGCGSQEIDLPKGANGQEPTANVRDGAKLFSQKCSGCHTISVAGASGSAYNVRDRERTDGPNFNVRKETADAVLYAIRNGGFSGAIMPENILVGDEAEKVAEFLEQYSGSEADVPLTPNPDTGTSDSP
jgi:mono/diheme cytochrome c family protein